MAEREPYGQQTPSCHTQARSLDQLMERVREAIELYIEVDGERVGQLVRL